MSAMTGKTCLVTGATSGIGKQTALRLAMPGATVPGAAVRLALWLRPGPAAGARTPVYLASSPEVAEVGGGYFVRCRPAQPSPLARDARAAARLWRLSTELAGLQHGGP
jgi:NAD(P)-dependent dehydrogenase (short-subunit alcohol dehydrogenase family)